MVEHQKHLESLEESVKAIAEAQLTLSADVGRLKTAVMEQEHLLEEINHILDEQGISPLGRPKPAAVPDLLPPPKPSIENSKPLLPTLPSTPLPVETTTATQQRILEEIVKELTALTSGKQVEASSGSALSSHRHSSSVAAHQSQFKDVTDRVIPLPAHSLVIHRPTTLEEAMGLTHLHEHQIRLERGSLKPALGSSKPILPTPPPPNPSSPIASVTLPGGNRVPFCRLTPTETAYRRAKPQFLLLDEESEPPDPLDPDLLPPAVFHTSPAQQLFTTFAQQLDKGKMFCNYAFAQEVCPHDLERIVKEIVGKCKGFPLSVAVIGGLGATSPRTEKYLGNISKDIHLILNSEDGDYCLDVLSLSYKYLPIHMKPCFLYMGLFA